MDDVSNGRIAGDGIGNTEIPFNASLSSDLDSDELQYRWDFENDGICDTSYSTDSTATYAWYDDYSGLVMVEVYDGEQTNTETATVTVNNIVLHFILKTLFGRHLAIPVSRTQRGGNLILVAPFNTFFTIYFAAFSGFQVLGKGLSVFNMAVSTGPGYTKTNLILFL